MSSKKAAPSLGDIVTAMFTDPPANTGGSEPSEPNNNPPPEVRQITAATPADMVAIKALADQCGELFDEIEELVGNKAAELGEKKQALKELLLNHGLKEVAVAGRTPITLATKRDKETSKKAITGVLGATDANALWSKLPVKTSHYISIPPRLPPEAPEA